MSEVKRVLFLYPIFSFVHGFCANNVRRIVILIGLSTMTSSLLLLGVLRKGVREKIG